MLTAIDVVLRAVQSAKKLTTFGLRIPVDHRHHIRSTPYNFTTGVDTNAPFPEISTLTLMPITGQLHHALLPRIGGTSVLELFISDGAFRSDCFLGMVADMPNIKNLTLNVTFPGLGFPPEPKGWGQPIGGRVLLPRLKELHVHIPPLFSAHVPDIVLRCGPAIEHLTIPWGAGSDSYTESFLSSLQNAPATIRSIHIECAFGSFDLTDRIPTVATALNRLTSLASVKLGPKDIWTSRGRVMKPNVSALVSAVNIRNNVETRMSPSLPFICLTVDPLMITGG